MTLEIVQVEKPKDSELANEEETACLKKIEWQNNQGTSDQDKEIAGETSKSDADSK